MATPMEHVEALALSMVARGAGTHPVEGHPGVEEAVVAFVAGDLGTVEVTLRAAGAPVRTFRFGIAAPVPAAPAAAAPPAALPTEQDVVRLRAVTEESPEDLCAWRENELLSSVNSISLAIPSSLLRTTSTVTGSSV